MGCQDLLEEVPGRSRKDQGVFSSPSDAKSWYKLKPSSSKSYSIKDETSSKWSFILPSAECDLFRIQLQMKLWLY